MPRPAPRFSRLVLGTALFAAVCTIPLQLQAATPHAGAMKPLRTAYGAPDLSGNWTNVSMTPEMRPGSAKAAVYTPEEVKKIESAAAKEETEANENSDPNAGAPTVGGDKPKEGTRPEFVAAGGGVGGYDRGWLDPGNHVMRVRGEPRTSILTTPDGRVPKPKAGVKSAGGFGGGLGSFENPENRSLGERCIIGFGRNAGPPMLANGFYNNNYAIVQTKDEVDIVIEMVHDVRKIHIGGTHRTDGSRPYMGDSIGRWDGSTLVVETTNIPKGQAYYGSWENLKVTERFTRLSPDRLAYAYTVEDPSRWEQPWGGEYEFAPLKGQIYEYACHEGNYALPGILAGARAEEAKKGAPQKGS